MTDQQTLHADLAASASQGLPMRNGPKPKTSFPGIPHTQLDQLAPHGLQEALWGRMSSLAGIETGQSLISVPGARATFLREGCAGHAQGGCMIGREFAHIHPPHDGSLHVTLPDEIRADAIAKGWAEPHPLAGTDKAPDTVVMLYGPRDTEEFEVIWSLVQASHRFALGQDG